MSAIDENHLHADPGIDGHHPHHGAPVGAGAAGPLQRERATTIFQKGAPGPPRVRLPAAGRARARRRRAAAGALSPRAAGAAAGGLRAGDRAPLRRHLQAQLRPGLGLLSAGLVHDEAQPAPARARGGAARARAPAPAAGRRARAGRAGADVQPAERARARSPACRTSRCSPRRARTASSPACC